MHGRASCTTILLWSYTVFGSIGPEGLKTLDAVARAGESTGSGDGTPNTPVEIRGVATG